MPPQNAHTTVMRHIFMLIQVKKNSVEFTLSAALLFMMKFLSPDFCGDNSYGKFHWAMGYPKNLNINAAPSVKI